MDFYAVAPKRMQWMSCIVAADAAAAAADAAAADEVVAAAADETAIRALLFDHRLLLAKGARVSSFISGTVATFLHQHLLPDSQVLAGLSAAAKERFGAVLATSIRDYTLEEMMFARAVNGRAAAAFPSRCGTSDFDPAPAKLLFSTALHDASPAAFHLRCDDQGPTLTLTKDTDGNIYAGYTRHSWRDSGDSCNVTDPTTFVLIAVVNKPPVMLRTKSVCRLAGCFPIFSSGLAIGSNYNSHRAIPESFVQSPVYSEMLTFEPVVVEVYGV